MEKKENQKRSGLKQYIIEYSRNTNFAKVPQKIQQAMTQNNIESNQTRTGYTSRSMPKTSKSFFTPLS